MWLLVFMQLKTGCCARLELSSTDEVTRDHTLTMTSAQVQPSTYFTRSCLLTQSVCQSVMLLLQWITTASTSEKRTFKKTKQTKKKPKPPQKNKHSNVWKSDIFKHALTHISSIPKGGIKWLLVMLEQVLDVCKAFNLEDLWFLLNDLSEANRQFY